ncbi:hypothetical protein GCM10007981_14620 [Thermocladium modestius]|uniref:Uncharacterized protein n=1 Tax=Thermocladium modestius TaxID=62609 RepID=A0A830GUR6_9CREN|nr:hypothetical protein GCM10007981_14620 [Thermocladium modestius]
MEDVDWIPATKHFEHSGVSGERGGSGWAGIAWHGILKQSKTNCDNLKIMELWKHLNFSLHKDINASHL